MLCSLSLSRPQVIFLSSQAFSFAWKMIRPWLDPETTGKIQVPGR